MTYNEEEIKSWITFLIYIVITLVLMHILRNTEKIAYAVGAIFTTTAFFKLHLKNWNQVKYYIIVSILFALILGVFYCENPSNIAYNLSVLIGWICRVVIEGIDKIIDICYKKILTYKRFR